MRKIKFRAYHAGKMFDVFAVNPMNHTVHLSHYQLTGREGDDVLVPWNDGIEDGGCELMQFTGLRDIKGVEIYEGDVVRRKSSSGTIELVEVKYRAPTFNIGDYMPEYGYTVIGNIYENPELLGDQS